jgi:hypothetical protein
MKLAVFSAIILFCHIFQAQTWHSIHRNDSFDNYPKKFKINTFQNQLWFIHDEKVSMIEENGEKHFFSEVELGDLWMGDDLDFAFTSQNIYFSKAIYGLYKLTNESNELLIDSSEIRMLSSNLDTVYVIMPTQPGFIKYVNGLSIIHYKFLSNICAKNEYLYADIGLVARIIGPFLNDWEYLDSDPQYLSAPINTMIFSRFSDTIYIATPKGISFAYNYDFLDTITPNNTVNMPSANVLEMEFDHLDRLWAVFGDENDQAFSLAMLENDTWINYYDENNSPIQFKHPFFGDNTFRGLEIDTLGNVWVCDDNNLHTLLSPTTPSWVGLHENKKPTFEIYPNPTENKVSIYFNSTNSSREIKLTDIKGNVLYQFSCFEQKLELSLEKYNSGIYFVEVKNDNGISYQKISKK